MPDENSNAGNKNRTLFWVRGDQLFEHTFELAKGEYKEATFLTIESKDFCDRFKYHKFKLAQIFSGLRYMSEELEKTGVEVENYEISADMTIIQVFEDLRADFDEVVFYKPANNDDWIKDKLTSRNFEIKIIANPAFYNIEENTEKHITNKKRYFFNDFYKDQRISTSILITQDGNPEGGAWNYDDKNREKLPKNDSLEIPRPKMKVPMNKIFDRVRKDIEQYFPDNPGDLDDYWVPFTHEHAQDWLEQFISERLEQFGTYEDALHPTAPFLFHSALSPLLNTGLLTPKQVLDEALSAYERRKTIELNQIEGFVRQILGWREYIKAIYDKIGSDQQRRNFFGHQREVPEAFYTGETGIIPLDDAIKRTLKYGYAHHIDRLMVIGNFMLLCNIHPQEVYKWYMELYIDAYEWVMVPNIFGMGQFADGGLMMTKPYVSSSNYIFKMSNYSKKESEEWAEIWDALFWEFIADNKDLLKKNARMGFMVSNLEKKTAEQRSDYQKIKREFINSLWGS